MSQNIFITGTGRESGLGYNFTLRYLENGDHVFATVRKPSEALCKLQEKYPQQLEIITMDIGSTESVRAAVDYVSGKVNYIDTLINNAVLVRDDYGEMKPFEELDLDDIAVIMNVSSVGPLRVIKAMLPLLKKAEDPMIVNISSDAGSCTLAATTCQLDYHMSKSALNMATKILHNKFEQEKGVKILAVHPGWVKTYESYEKAPFTPYEQCERLRLVFEDRRKRYDEGAIFVNYANEIVPW